MPDSMLNQNLSAEVKKNLFGNAYINMLWHCPSDPRFSYFVHLPDSYMEDKNPHYRLLVIIHGTGCSVEPYMKAAKELGDPNKFAIVAPLFPGGLIDYEDFNSYKLLSDQGVRYDQVLLSMIDDVKKRYPGVKTDKFFLFGHSGGGQFTNRFLYVHPERLYAAAIGAPGRPTYLNQDEDYYWGIRDFKKYFDKEPDLDEIKKVPVMLIVGEKDTSFIGKSPYGTCRVERMRSLKKNLEDHGVKVELTIIPGYAHEGGEKERVQAAQQFFLNNR